MRTPEEVNKDIEKLKKELEESKNYHQWAKLTDDSVREKMIGFFNIGNTELILFHLDNGKLLQYRHGCYGNVEVRMNPQRNRILVSENKDINETNILNFVMRATGEWFVKRAEKEQ